MVFVKVKKTASSSIGSQREAASKALFELISTHAPDLIPYETAHTDMGRPYIKDAANVDISISHTDELALSALIMGEGKRVGADIEKIKRANLRIAKKYFTEEEYTYLSALSDDDAAREFTLLWTAYEAKSKYLGGGFADIRKNADLYTESIVFEEKYAISICTNKKEDINYTFCE